MLFSLLLRCMNSPRVLGMALQGPASRLFLLSAMWSCDKQHACVRHNGELLPHTHGETKLITGSHGEKRLIGMIWSMGGVASLL